MKPDRNQTPDWLTSCQITLSASCCQVTAQRDCAMSRSMMTFISRG